MALQNFVDYVGPKISAAWLNIVDRLRETVFEDAATKAAARTALMLDAPLEITNGGTGNRTGLIYYAISSAETNAGVVPVDYFYPPGDVRRYGAVADGLTNDYAAFADAWSVTKGTGGTLLIPPGDYFLNSTWVLDLDPLYKNYKISGYGARLLSGPLVTYAIQVEAVGINTCAELEGLFIDHRNNSTALGAIRTRGTWNLTIRKVLIEADDTSASYTGIDIGPITAGNDNTNSFWTVIDSVVIHKRFSIDGADIPVGIRLRGTANATKIVNCQIASCVYGIMVQTDSLSTGMPNAVHIMNNSFESVTYAITIVTIGAVYMPTGMQIAFNRVETVSIFLVITGGAISNPGHPICTFYNYLTVGSVTTFLSNPDNQYISSFEPSYFGVDSRQEIGGPSDFLIVTEGSGHNLVVRNRGGLGGDYYGAHLVIGAYHLWVEAATGKLRIKGSAPTADNDGTVVGTQV